MFYHFAIRWQDTDSSPNRGLLACFPLLLGFGGRNYQFGISLFDLYACALFEPLSLPQVAGYIEMALIVDNRCFEFPEHRKFLTGALFQEFVPSGRLLQLPNRIAQRKSAIPCACRPILIGINFRKRRFVSYEWGEYPCLGQRQIVRKFRTKGQP